MKKLLLIIDCQKAFINQYTKQYVDKIELLLNKKEYSNYVCTIFKNSEKNPLYNLLGYKKCINDEDCKLMLGYNATVIEKNTYSAVNSELIQHIAENNIEEVYLCGFDTDGCVLKTAFDLFEKNIKTYILQDYCMSSGGEKYHKEAIDILKRSIGNDYII
jgi:nicotinamidase-related amidase